MAKGIEQDTSYYTSAHAKRVFKQSDEAKNVGFALGATCVIAFIILVASFDISTMKFTFGTLIVAALFIFEALVLLIFRVKLKAELTRKFSINRLTRLFGIILILFGFTGNVFSFAAGCMLVKKKKNLEYQIGIYVVLVDMFVMLISAINIFKGYVMSTFFSSMFLLLGVTAIHVAAMILMPVVVKGNVTTKAALPIAIILILSALSGNLMAILQGLIVLRKSFNKDPEISTNWIDILKRLFRSNTAAMGLFFVLMLLMISIWANKLFDYSVAVDNNYQAILLPPSLQYPLGTDDYGRCVFSRVVFGAKISLITGFFTVSITAIIGVACGAVAGYFQGTAEAVIMRIMDVLYATPGLLLPIAVVSSLGTSLPCIIIAIAICPIPAYARTIRASILTLKDKEFVQAAKACGAKNGSIIVKHLLPNSMAPLIVRMTMSFGANVLSLSSLSYLGVGVQAHIPEWGSILKTGSTYLESATWLAIFPGIMIILLVLSFNFMGDGLRDALDPKLK